MDAVSPLAADIAPLADTAPPALTDQVALARLYGQPLFKIPHDLYIPPDALEVFLEAFEGPLDLLLYLIRKQNFNILDIPLVQVTDQYLGYVEEIRSRNLELAAEYLLMAAMLIELKSRMLLPPKAKEGEDEAADPRAELVRRLLEYEKMKLAAQQINALPHHGRDFVQAQVQAAWRDIVRRAKLVQHHHISREALSVREYMSRVLKQLQGHTLGSLLPDTRQDAQRINQLADQRAEAHEGLPERKTTLLSVPTRYKWRSDVVQSKARFGPGSGVYWL